MAERYFKQPNTGRTKIVNESNKLEINHTLISGDWVEITEEGKVIDNKETIDNVKLAEKDAKIAELEEKLKASSATAANKADCGDCKTLKETIAKLQEEVKKATEDASLFKAEVEELTTKLAEAQKAEVKVEDKQEVKQEVKQDPKQEPKTKA